MAKVNAKGLKAVKGREGPVTFDDVGEVFGQDFWILLVGALMDAQLAARAIQGAMERLRAGEAEDGTDG